MGCPAERPPGGSIRDRDDFDGPTLWWPLPGAGAGRFGLAAFLGFWLCGWAVGWVAAAREIASGKGGLFLLAWFGCWTLGGLAATWSLWRIIRRPRPESVTLGAAEFAYDPGSAPPDFSRRGDRAAWPGWNPTTGDRVTRPLSVARAELGAFTLDRVGDRQRLSFDHGAKRVEVGACLGEPEREWLHARLERWRVG